MSFALVAPPLTRAVVKENPMQGLENGRSVHYVHGDGLHTSAVITRVHDLERGVVDLYFTSDEGSEVEGYSRKTVVYSEEPKSYTWHFIEGEQGATKQETLL